MKKINWKKNDIVKWLYGCIAILLIVILIYTRFVNLGWGLPYPMHPDERNMADAIQSLNCEVQSSKFKVQSCFNPHFFAYGQFPIYLAYLLSLLIKLPPTISLRLISALASVAMAGVMLGILGRLGKLGRLGLLGILVIIFSPVLIQFAHFGTTESLLILFYSLIIYISLLFVQKKLLTSHFLLLTSFISGLALATKVSSVVFLALPIYTIMTYTARSYNRRIITGKLILLTAGFFILFSPHNFISFKEFFSSMRYESEVALGQIEVFYTRQFEGNLPVIFQALKIFPYALGWPVFMLGGLGLLGVLGRLGKEKEINLLRIAFLIVFLPNAFMFAKWTRFMAPVFPIMLLFAILFISNIKNQISKIHIKNQKFLILFCHFAFCILIFAIIVPGIAYLSIYQNPDVRFQASEWIYKNIPQGSYILSETANVVDIPIENPNPKILNPKQIKNPNYKIISFNFYDLDKDPLLQEELRYYIQKTDYIIIPSRRVFKDHSKKKYPLLKSYYEELFSGELGFKEVAKFESFPTLFVSFDDEDAEETWTVFDHPVTRIFKRI